MPRVLLILVAFGALVAGSAQAIEVTPPPPVTLAPLPIGAKPKPISLTRIAASIAPGTPWAEAAFIGAPVPMPCTLGGLDAVVTRWEEANNRIKNIDSFERVFRQELTSAGFVAGGDRTNLFEEQQVGDLQLGALITDMRVKSCTLDTLAGATLGGSAVMTIEWQIYSVVQGRVVARVTTRGGATLKQSRNGTGFAILLAAFGDNVRRLTIESEFREIILAANRTPAPPAPTSLRFAKPVGPVTVSTAAQSVVAVFAGEGHGSGVVISPDGYILTNHHVAGSTGEVRVRWADGTESAGEVVRADPRRDVALIKVPPKVAGLVMRTAPANLGEPVFAIGTPLDARFQGSVTKGIVSAVRTYEGQNYIQSDVVINGGNSGGPLIDENGAVIGICVSGMDINGAPAGINFFIPVADALKALGLTQAT